MGLPKIAGSARLRNKRHGAHGNCPVTTQHMGAGQQPSSTYRSLLLPDVWNSSCRVIVPRTSRREGSLVAAALVPVPCAVCRAKEMALAPPSTDIHCATTFLEQSVFALKSVILRRPQYI